MKEKSRPAPYSTTDAQETLAIAVFKRLIDHYKVKTDIKERDKYPNIDGYIELVDDSRSPIGKLEIQIRKIGEDVDKPRIQVPISLFSYCEVVACYPVLLVGVDVKNERAYWLHIDEDLISTLDKEADHRTVVVPFSPQKFIDGKRSDYIAQWAEISAEYQMKIRRFDDVKKLLQLSDKSDMTLHISRGSIERIHWFLDEINGLLDQKFRIVKQKYYPGAWKLGLAYHEFKVERIIYTLYPIPYEKNDTQIKSITQNLYQEFSKMGTEFIAHFMENPIEVRPYDYAAEIVESETLMILENKLLNHGASQFLASEFFFELVYKYSEQLELDRKDVYSLEEIRDICQRYIVNVAERKLLPKVDFSPRTFEQFVDYLTCADIKGLKREYESRDFSRLGKGVGLKWNLFSLEAVRNNLITFFANLPKAYEEFVAWNFSELTSDLPIYGNSSRVVVVFNVKDWYESYQKPPTIRFFFLTPSTSESLKIELFEEDKDGGISNLLQTNFGKKVELDGHEYRVVSMSHGVMDFIYEELPMQKYVYSLLEKNLVEYFKKIKEEHLTVATPF